METVAQYISQRNFQERYVFNIDETRSEPRDQTAQRYVRSNNESRMTYIRNSDLRTTVNIISAEGLCWITVFIYKDDSTATPSRAGTIPIYAQEVCIGFNIYV